jgi:hypothetical protein
MGTKGANRMKTLSRVLLGKDTDDDREMPKSEDVTVHPAVPDIKLGLGPVTHVRKSVVGDAHEADSSQSHRSKDKSYSKSQETTRRY